MLYFSTSQGFKSGRIIYIFIIPHLRLSGLVEFQISYYHFSSLWDIYNFDGRQLCGISIARQCNKSDSCCFPLNSKPYGMTYSDWGAKQWQWLISIPSSKTPMSDNVGTRCFRRTTRTCMVFTRLVNGGKGERHSHYTFRKGIIS